MVLDLVGEKLRRPTPAPSQFSIFRVPDVLCKLNEKAYEPELLAIGPYHHSKDHLSAFEEHNISYLQTLIERTCIRHAEYVRATWVLVERGRNCYGGSISFDKNESVQMMFFDGCFIVEVIRKFGLPHLRGDDGPIFKQGWMLPHIGRDMIFLKNQLPFSVVWKLFIMSEMSNIPRNESFLVTILRFFYGKLSGKGFRRDGADRFNDCPIKRKKHLVNLAHDNWLPSPSRIEAYGNNGKNNSDWIVICSATKIEEVGIKFHKADALKMIP